MATINFRVAVFLLVTFLSSGSLVGCFGQSNYDECIIESIKGVTSDVAARLVALSCREKFPEKPKEQKKTRELSSEELEQVTGRAGDSIGNYFHGNLYNGNTDVTITQVSFNITTRLSGQEVSRTYIADINISSQKTADFTLSIVKSDKGADYSWSLVAARGY